jgi:putative endonuclease
MGYVVYILQSEMNGRYYIGHTSDIEERIQSHNNGKVRSTKAYRPWKIVYSEPYASKQEAYCREIKIKSYKHGEAFKKLIKVMERC